MLNIQVEAPTKRTMRQANSMVLVGQHKWDPVPSYGHQYSPADLSTTTSARRYFLVQLDEQYPTGNLPSYRVISDEAQFQQLLSNWHAERGATSSITEMAMCRSYLRIIAMGPKVISLIFAQMEREGEEPDMWFMALQMLTGADPITEEARGDFKAMADLWLHWGRANGYAW